MLDHTSGKIKQFGSLVLYFDGGCEPHNPGGVATSGWVIYDSEFKKILAEEGKIAQDGGELATNNYGEYSALLFALSWLYSQNWRGQLTIKGDSKLIVEQVRGSWKCKAPHLEVLRGKIWDYFEKLNLQIVTDDSPLPEEGKNAVSLHWIKRDLNQYANDLCRVAYKEYKL